MSRSARALADRFISHGSPGGVLETAGDISRLTGSSVIKVMRGALGSWRMRAHGYRWQTDRTFLSQTALHHASGDIRHPDRKSTRLNYSPECESRMPSSACTKKTTLQQK